MASTARTTKTGQLIRLFGREIAQGAYTPGSALPSEAELCERFAASRNVMREVIKVLSTKRLIDAQPHRGLFVMPRERWNFVDADVLEWMLELEPDPDLIRSLSEVRSLIEPAITRWAAERASAVDLVEIEASFNRMVSSQADPEDFQEADIGFHRAILLATHNLVILQLADAIGALQRTIFDHTFLSDPQHMALTLSEHGGLLETIRLKNPRAAEDLCRDMVARTAERLTATIPGEQKAADMDSARRRGPAGRAQSKKPPARRPG